MPKPNVIAVDVDGVLVEFLSGFERAFEATIGRPAVRISPSWALDVAYGISAAELDAVWRAVAAMHIYRDLPPLPGAFEALRMLDDAGYEVHAVTAIEPQYWDDRYENLSALGFKGNSIHAVGHGPKTPVLQQLRPVLFADDQVKHLHQAPFVPNRVWIHTQDEQFPEIGGVHTHEAPSLLEFVQHWLEDAHHHLETPAAKAA